ncbi:hypothetical protein HA052_21410 [Chromobacterium haemolyticum]|uniref:Uncharacterized protein n=1 Tax=Chromobacterium fluminis TaxID=3044269 RepID=A0ABX0LE03_9NEIS|nr:hypothetical protein [Chromobacterium haemolyticum]NHR07752.1 hypothetical protein [Chromobacterium haemolyticum]
MAEHKTKTQTMTFNILIPNIFPINTRNAATAGMITALVFSCEWPGARPRALNQARGVETRQGESVPRWAKAGKWVADQGRFLTLEPAVHRPVPESFSESLSRSSAFTLRPPK